jgi:hypothetical protein
MEYINIYRNETYSKVVEILENEIHITTCYKIVHGFSNMGAKKETPSSLIW